MAARIRVLGLMRVRRHRDRWEPVGSSQQRTLLATLLMSDGPISTDRLIEELWPERRPRDPANGVQILVGRLRRALDDGSGNVLRTARPGYHLHLGPGDTDADEFETRVREGFAAVHDGDHARARDLLVSALELWRGPAFADVPATTAMTTEATRLEEQRLSALEERIALDLAAGKDAELVPELQKLIDTHPFRERGYGHLMLALHRSGRQAEAFELYISLYRKLDAELGVEPGYELQRLHQRMLRREPELENSPVQPHRGPAPPPAVPRQLPSVTRHFVGRARLLKQLDALLNPTDEATSPIIAMITGTAGIGKTTLAVHWAHLVRDRFPDGQLFIDLYGYTQGMDPIEPGEALDQMLHALGIPGPQVPASLEERATLYRTRLADQQVLIMLDNAATESQVQPLLPGSPGCLVVVTSRRRLAGLDHTSTLSMGTLPVPEAVRLFIHIAEDEGLAGQPADLLVELVELCDRLPLAIRIAAARLRAHPAWDPSHLVERLRDQRHRLSELEAGQRSVTAALDLSYQHLDPEQQHAYQLLGRHPGPDIDTYATAALLDSTGLPASRLLERLLDAHLLVEPAPGRYRFHDLIRSHAAATTPRVETEPTEGTALDRLLDYYRYTASLAADTAYPHQRQRRPAIPAARTPSPDLPGPAMALAWLETELSNLLASARYAAEHDRPEHILCLSTILRRHLYIRGRYHDAETLHHQALTAARATDHRAGELDALTGLGHIDRRQGRFVLAIHYLGQALRIARILRDRGGELDALTGLGDVHRHRGRYAQAADHLGWALQIARTIGDRAGELDALTGLGDVHRPQGRYEQAVDCYGQALQIARTTGNRTGEQVALTGLGDIHWRQSRFEQAADHYKQALQIARTTGCRAGERNALAGLGQVHGLQGRHEQAADHYEQALQIARTTGNRIGELSALTSLGQVHRMQVRYEEAADHCHRLLDLARRAGDPNFEFEAWQGLGRLQHATGHPEVAIANHEQALALASDLGHPDDQARAYDGLAHAYQALNQPERAHTHWRQALDILERLGIDHTDDAETTTAAIRAHLTGLPVGRDL